MPWSTTPSSSDDATIFRKPSPETKRRFNCLESAIGLVSATF